MAKGFHEVRVIFDFYEQLSLKNATRKKRGSSTSNLDRFILDDNTRLSYSLSRLLSNVQTKQEITVYLAGKCRTFLENNGIKHLVSANHETHGNLPCIEIMNNHEEADTLMIWHCVHFNSTTMKEESSSITVFSPDTDVACLLIAFKKRMSTNVYLHTSKHIISVDSVYQSIGQVKADALLSLHAISGCDTTGRFLGKGKTS